MEKEFGNTGYDLGCQIDQVLKLAVRQAIISHTLRKGCEFEKNAYEGTVEHPAFAAAVTAIRNLPEFTQLGGVLETFERCKRAA